MQTLVCQRVARCPSLRQPFPGFFLSCRRCRRSRTTVTNCCCRTSIHSVAVPASHLCLILLRVRETYHGDGGESYRLRRPETNLFCCCFSDDWTFKDEKQAPPKNKRLSSLRYSFVTFSLPSAPTGKLKNTPLPAPSSSPGSCEES